MKVFLRKFITKQLDYSNAVVIQIDPDRAKILRASHEVYELETGYFKSYSSDLSQKMAYEALAALLGIGRLVPHTELCFAVFSGKGRMKGAIQDKSCGSDIWDISKQDREQMITPAFQRDINILRLFDVICHEQDHSLNNYYPVIDQNGQFETVSAFDNGGAGSFNFHMDISFSTYYGCDPFVDSMGSFTSPFVDKEFATAINSVSFPALLKSLKHYLSFAQIIATWGRMKKLRSCIAKNELRLLDIDDWSIATIHDELSGKYGNTYLYSLVNQWCDRR